MKLSTVLASGCLLAAAALALPATGAEPAKPFVVNNEAMGVPVFPYDITDRPYVVIGEVTAGVRKATIFSQEASQKKIYTILWEHARKLKADAVVKAQYGESHVSAMSWGKTNASGTAVRFTGPAVVPTTASAPLVPAN